MSTGLPDEAWPVPVNSPYFLGCDPVLFNKFRTYHFRNPNTFCLFVRYLRELVQSGHTKGSTWLIVNRIRWDAVINHDEEFEFALSNDFNALYSRLTMHYFPQHRDFFSIKRLKPHRRNTARDAELFGAGFEQRFEDEYGVRLPHYQQQLPLPGDPGTEESDD